VVCWKYQAEQAERKLHKGALACVIGSIHYEEWEDREGYQQKRTEIICNRLIFLKPAKGMEEHRGGHGAGHGGGDGGGHGDPERRRVAQDAMRSDSSSQGSQQGQGEHRDEEDDLPF